ncbi:hypothetical protein QBC38DRAFT_487217 [Podospora fimiseda]|uniref:Uncharacterized protein n=1 Tax=Podospora fimiseda TaxID=252190 RepID=A0AAN7BI44_9PEZI|nr:hypothetical protein QBC38DRAFT_487217 [Podospora fimiseda]
MTDLFGIIGSGKHRVTARLCYINPAIDLLHLEMPSESWRFHGFIRPEEIVQNLRYVYLGDRSLTLPTRWDISLAACPKLETIEFCAPFLLGRRYKVILSRGLKTTAMCTYRFPSFQGYWSPEIPDTLRREGLVLFGLDPVQGPLDMGTCERDWSIVKVVDPDEIEKMMELAQRSFAASHPGSGFFYKRFRELGEISSPNDFSDQIYDMIDELRNEPGVSICHGLATSDYPWKGMHFWPYRGKLSLSHIITNTYIEG